MYKKYMAALLLINLIALAAVINLTELKVNYVVATEAFHLNVEKALMPLEEMSFVCEMDRPASGQRILCGKWCSSGKTEPPSFPPPTTAGTKR